MPDAMSNTSLPALLGGAAVRPEGPPKWPRPDSAVYQAVIAAMESGSWGQYHGEHVAALESELARFHDSPHALTCASGTLAVETALRAVRVSAGDDVLMAAYDYEANFMTVHAVGARPVLVDVAPHNWNLDPSKLAEAVTPQTRAILCSHLHGGLIPMMAVIDFARARGIAVVEDACQAAGAVVQGKAAGAWGDVGVLSFGGSKLLTAGRGGAVICSNPQLHQRAKVWLQRGPQQWAPLSELQAAALRPQVLSLEAATRHRWEMVRELAGEVADLPGIRQFENAVGESVPAFFKLGFRYDGDAVGLPRDQFIAAVQAEGIALTPGFRALHVGRSPSRFQAGGDLGNAQEAHNWCVTLHHPVLGLGRDDVRQVATAIRKVIQASGQGLFALKQ